MITPIQRYDILKNGRDLNTKARGRYALHSDHLADKAAALQRIADAVCTYLDNAELGEVMNDNAVKTLKSDIAYFISHAT